MTDAVPGILRAISEQVVPQANTLRDLDSQIGDGDLGITVTRGMEAVVNALGELEGKPVSDQLSRSGMAFNRAAASTFGVLFATAMMRGGAAVKGKENVGAGDIAEIGRAIHAGLPERHTRPETVPSFASWISPRSTSPVPSGTSRMTW